MVLAMPKPRTILIEAREEKMKNLRLVGLILLLSVILMACSSTANSSADSGFGQVVPVDGGGEYIDITPQELQEMLEAEDFFFVNVHVPYEGEIPATDAFIAFDEVEARLGDFPSEKGAKIVLYCRSGSMSAIAAKALVQAGYTNIFNLNGGFRAWEEAGLEIVK